MTLFAGRRSRGARLAMATATFMLLLAPMAVADEARVTIDNFTFSPATLTVKPGTKVTFVNHDDIPHTVVGVTGGFRSKALDTDDSYAFTFETAGDFAYFCGLHPHMTGKVVVTP
jgi:plastocyanin